MSRRRLTQALAALTVLGLAATLSVGAALSGAGHDGPITDHFDGTTFHNAQDTPLPSLPRALAAWRGFLDRGPWDPWREVTPAPRLTDRVTDGRLRATFVNHATVLLQVDGVNLLTDPIWSERCSPVSFAGPARHHAPGIDLEDLPPIDVVLISHDHYDHLDLPTLARLHRDHAPTFVVGLGNASTLQEAGIDGVVELDWGGSVTHGPLTITGEATRHFSGRGLFDRQTTLWLGFHVAAPSGAIYVAGDTGYGDHFAATRARHGPVRLALLPIGAYAPRAFMGPIHMDPADAVRAHLDLGAHASLGIHFGTFRLTSEAQDAPAEEVAAARLAAGLGPHAFWVPDPGATFEVPKPRPADAQPTPEATTPSERAGPPP